MKKNKTFEEYYFKGYYHGIGDFSLKRDKQLSNWFLGVLNFLEKLYPVKMGGGKKLIEFGCATGVTSDIFRKFGYEVTATDVSKYAVSKAKKNYVGINFKVHDMQKSFSKENCFDVAVAFDVIEHLENPEAALKNVFNILKKDGTILLSTPNDYKHISNDPTHINVKRPEEWRKLVKEAGFRNIVVKQVAFLPYLYRIHWRLNIFFPFAVSSKYIISPVFIIAKK